MIPRIKEAKNRGGALVLVTGIGVIMTLLGLTVITLGMHSRLNAVRTGLRIRARSAADAGLAVAIFKMKKKLIDEAIWDNTTLPLAFVAFEHTPASFNYWVSGSPPTFTITSVGTCSHLQENVYAKLGISSYWEGIGVKEIVDVKLGTTFGTLPEGDDMVIRTNSIEANAMKFKAFVTVPGDVIFGPGGDADTVIDTKSTTIIQGESYAANEELIFPPVLPPDPPLPYRGSITAAHAVVDADGQYDRIDVPQSGLLEVTGPCALYVTGPMILGQGSELIIRAGGSLALYLGGNLEDKNSMGITNENPQANTFTIYGLPTCLQIDLKAKSDLYAAVYAPSADINLFNNGDFTGAVVGNSFYMKNSGNFVYDTILASASIDDPTARFVVERWWED